MGFENLLLGFGIALQPHNLGVAVLGITLGTIIGVLPGLGGANGVAILLPLTFSMHPTSAIILLTSLYWGALFGGAITSILFNIPGEPWSVATTFDGYPMARQGRSGEALTAAFTSSFVGARINPKVVWQTWKTLPRYYRTFVRGAFIGFWMGFKPGGATPASFMSYAFAKRFARHPERFGHGEIEGVIAPETAAHAAGSAALLPMITLGIPGSPTAAVMLGGLIIWGLQPGPMLFQDKPDFVWGLIASMYTGNVIGVAMVLAFVPFFAAILRIPFAILTPLIVAICAVGSYAVHDSMIDIWYMLLFGVIGYVFKKLDYPLAPLVLALVLGDLAENALRQSLIMSQGSLLILFQRPISGVISAVALLFFALPVINPYIRRARAGKPPVEVAAPHDG